MDNIFEHYLDDFNSTIDIWKFVLNVVIVTVIAYSIKLFYIRFGRAISNREKFSNNFIPLALSTLLIITVIKSSIALSLGLVGALSIVRFRAAIKDPEELTYLFLVIGLGLIGGADKPILAVVSFAIFLPLLYLNNLVRKNKNPVKNKATIHVKIHNSNLDQLSQQIAPLTEYLQLKRADVQHNTLTASFYCKLNDSSSLDILTDKIKNLDGDSTISYVDQPDMLL